MKKTEVRSQKSEVRSQEAGLRSALRPSPFALRFSSERGIALILTLAIITLVTLILIGFTVSMRVENSASKSFNDVLKAREFAQAAVDQAVAQIREATTRNANVLNYVTFPGAIYDFNGAVATRIPLYSYSANIASKFDFNADFWITAQNGEFPGVGNAVMNDVSWIYVAEDDTVAASPPVAYLAPPGTYPIPQPGPLLPTRPIIGRFAFWVDDEASKINLNTAGQNWTTPDLYGASDPLAVDLTQLWTPPFLYAADIVSGGPLPLPPPYPRGTWPYATIDEVRRANTGITLPLFNANRFSMTTYSDDPGDLDVLDRQRLDLSLLTEAKDIIDIIGPNSAYARLSDNVALRNVYSSARAFANKYPIVSVPSGTLDGLKQIIANIIAYQLNPRLPGDLAKLPDANPAADPPAYLGLARAPYVNEVKVSYDTTGVGIIRTITIELFYPYGADGSDYLASPADFIEVKNLPVFGAVLPPNYAASAPPGLAGKRFNSATPYYTFQFVDPDLLFTLPGPDPVEVPATTVTVNYYRSGKRLDCAQVPLPAVGIRPTAVSFHGAQVNDPCVNENITEWTPYRTGPFSGTLLPSPPGLSGPVVSQNSVYVGDTSKAIIRALPILSVGELGYIHKPGSWQYLHLQPQPASEQTPIRQIPDWAMLDIFTVPNAKTAGRININSLMNPGLATPAPATPRLVPLEALLSSVITPFSLNTVAHEIYNDDNVTIPVARGADPYGMTFVFDTIGEVCEVLGLANGATTEAGKEVAIRRIANLITVRSNTFTIWVIAQSIKEPNLPLAAGQQIGRFDPGVDLITGEVRAKAVVERYENPRGTVRFRVRYFRYL